MKLKQVNRLKLHSLHSYARAGLRVSAHGAQRAAERSQITPEAVLEVVLQGFAVLLPYKGRGCTYHLFYREEHDAFFVAVVSADRYTYHSDKPSIITVLTVDAFEQGGGIASRRFRRTAASRVMGSEKFQAWDVRHYGNRVRPTGLRVIVYWRDEVAGSDGHVVFTGPPVCKAYIDEHGIQNVLGHPGVLPWFKRQLDKTNVSVDHIVSLRIADTDKVELRVDAENHDCPNCAILTRSTEHTAKSADQQCDNIEAGPTVTGDA